MNEIQLNRRSLMMAMLGAAGATAAGGAAAQAQTSDKPITFLVPQPAGNATDGIARKSAPILQKALGQTVIVENLPGAGGSLGLGKALASGGDGQMLTISSQTELILTPLSYANARYKPEEFRCIALTGVTPYALVSRPDLPVNTLAELVALARQSEGKPLAHGNIGTGSLIHLLGEVFGRKLKLPLVQVPYKGTPPMVQDLMGGQIDLSFLPIAGSTISLIESGKLKAFGTTAADTMAALPKVMPLRKFDASLHDFVYAAWGGVFVPRKTSEAQVQRLYKAYIDVLNDAEVKSWSAGTGVKLEEPRPLAQLEQFYRNEIQLTQALARQINLTPQ